MLAYNPTAVSDDIKAIANNNVSIWVSLYCNQAIYSTIPEVGPLQITMSAYGYHSVVTRLYTAPYQRYAFQDGVRLQGSTCRAETLLSTSLQWHRKVHLSLVLFSIFMDSLWCLAPVSQQVSLARNVASCEYYICFDNRMGRIMNKLQ